MLTLELNCHFQKPLMKHNTWPSFVWQAQAVLRSTTASSHGLFQNALSRKVGLVEKLMIKVKCHARDDKSVLHATEIPPHVKALTNQQDLTKLKLKFFMLC